MDNQLRIAVIVSEFPALSETFILNRITGLIDRGHSVEIFAINSRDKDSAIHQDVIAYDLLSKTYYESELKETLWGEFKRRMSAMVFLFRNAKKMSILKQRPNRVQIRHLTRFKRTGSFDVIHAFFGTNGNIAVLARDLGIIDGPIAVSFHGFDLSQKIKENPNIYNTLFEKAELFLPVCEYYENRLIALGCPPERIKVHPSAIDVKQFAPDINHKEAGKLNIISIGRLVEKKGFRYSIEAVARYIYDNPKRSVKYDIIGDGPLHDKLNRLIMSLEMQDHIKIHGSKDQKQILSEIQKSDLLICPSVVSTDGDEDTVPNVMKEAMACKVPVIASWHGGIPELVKDEQNGFLVKEKDIKAIKDKISQLADLPELRKKMGEKGRQFVKKNYDIEFHNDNISLDYIKLAKSFSKYDRR